MDNPMRRRLAGQHRRRSAVREIATAEQQLALADHREQEHVAAGGDPGFIDFQRERQRNRIRTSQRRLARPISGANVQTAPLRGRRTPIARTAARRRTRTRRTSRSSRAGPDDGSGDSDPPGVDPAGREGDSGKAGRP